MSPLAAAGEPRPPLFLCHAMGTRFELLLPGLAAPKAGPIAERVFEIVTDWHDTLNAFSPAGFVGTFNVSDIGTWHRTDGDLWRFLMFCHESWQKSAGAFDPTMGGLMRHLGLRDQNPHPAEAPAWGFQHLEFDDIAMAVRRTVAVELDFGSVAKGWAIDAAAKELRALGVTEALLHGGTSTVVGIGNGPLGNGWHIAAMPDLAGPVVQLRNEAMSVSSPRGRTVAGAAVHHVIDPRTGRSAACRRWSVCTGPSAAETDVWSTVSLVLDREHIDGLECVKLTLDKAAWDDPQPAKH